MSKERVRFWHHQIMRETQFARMHRQDPPTVWISRGLYDMIFDSLAVGGHMISRLEGLTYFGCPCIVMDDWEGVRYIVGYEGGDQ